MQCCRSDTRWGHSVTSQLLFSAQLPAVLSAHCVLLIWPPPHMRCALVLTVLVRFNNLGSARWYKIQQQMCRVCDSQRAAVLQHRPAEVRGDCRVLAASLRPEGGERGGEWSDEGMNDNQVVLSASHSTYGAVWLC